MEIQAAFQTDIQVQRLKSRQRSKRLYDSRRNLRDNLQHEVDNLELELKYLLSIHHQLDAQPTNKSTSLIIQNRAYVELAQTMNALTKENEELRRQLASCLESEKLIQRLLIAQEKAVLIMKQEEKYKRQNPFLKVNRLSEDQCTAIARKSYLDIIAFRQSDTCWSTGVSVLGWRDRRAQHQNKLMFSLEKTFPGRQTDKMAKKVWEILSLPEPVVIMRPRDAKAHFHVIQRLNENAVVYYYTLEREDVDVRVRAFILAMWVDLGPNGYMVILRNLNPKTFLVDDGDCTAPVRRGRRKIVPHKESFWLNVFLWSVYEYVGEQKDSCRQTFGGEIEGTTLASTGWWAIEILEIALRMESREAGQTLQW